MTRRRSASLPEEGETVPAPMTREELEAFMAGVHVGILSAEEPGSGKRVKTILAPNAPWRRAVRASGRGERSHPGRRESAGDDQRRGCGERDEASPDAAAVSDLGRAHAARARSRCPGLSAVRRTDGRAHDDRDAVAELNEAERTQCANQEDIWSPGHEFILRALPKSLSTESLACYPLAATFTGRRNSMTSSRAGVSGVVLSVAWALVWTSVAHATTDAAEAVIYADHLPAYRPNGTPFPASPFLDDKECTSAPGSPCSPPDPDTRLRMEVATGLKLPLGTMSWSLASWRKYVFIAPFTDRAAGVLANVDDQQIGIFNTETKAFCLLDLQPGKQNASVEWFAVVEPSDPQARQTRVYFQGFPLGDVGSAFGYFVADLDNDDPCNGWTKRAFTRLEIANATPGMEPCFINGLDQYECTYDGVALLDAERVVLHGWQGSRIVVARVDGAGTLSIPDVMLMPEWQPDGPGGICYRRLPVASPLVDPNRPIGNQRFASSFDIDCRVPMPYPEDCAAPVTLPHTCPITEAACEEGESCKVCDLNVYDFVKPCTKELDCPGFGFYAACVEQCLTHPANRCSGAASVSCSSPADCPAGQTCVCSGIPGGPAQEFRFDGTSLTAVSPQFQREEGSTTNVVTYDTAGDLWVGNYAQTGNVFLYWRTADASYEHGYTNPAPPLVPADQMLAFTNFIPPGGLFPANNGATSAVQVGSTMYLSGRTSIQHARNPFGIWNKNDVADPFKVTKAINYLPPESGLCAGGSNNGAWCSGPPSCPGGTCQQLARAIGPRLAKGGSPASLWDSPMFFNTSASANLVKKDKAAYLIRVPLATDIPDGATTTRPAIAWTARTTGINSDRLWLVSVSGGSLKYRVRDDGVWSAWTSFTNPLTTAGGAVLAANDGVNGSRLDVFVRAASDNRIYTSSLTSSFDCTPGSPTSPCAWSSWTLVTNSPTTTVEPAAAYSGAVMPILVVRGSDGVLRYSIRAFGSWSAWTTMTGLTTNVAPSISYRTADPSAWVVAREASTGKVRYSRIIGAATYTAWADVGGTAPVTWVNAPAIIWDGTWVRVFASEQGGASSTYEIVNDGSGWGSWRRLISTSSATLQPTAANVNGTVNLVTTASGHAMQEQAIE
jgi:hypothetical protein